MTRTPRAALLDRGLYAATVLLVLIGLGLQLAPSTARLEAKAANDSSSVTASAGVEQPADTASPRAADLSDPHSSPVSAQGSPSAFDTVLRRDMSSPNANNAARVALPGAYQAVVVANIFSPQRTPPRIRYRPRAEGEFETPVPAPARATPRGPRLFGVTLRASGAVALIDADPAVPGAEIYRVGDAIAGGLLVDIGPAAAIIERNGVRQIIRLESEPKGRDR